MIRILLWIVIYIIWGHTDSPLPFLAVMKCGYEDDKYVFTDGTTYEGLEPPSEIYKDPNNDVVFTEIVVIGPFATRTKAQGYVDLLMDY